MPPSRAQPAGPTVPPRRRCRGSPVDAPGARSKGASLFDASQVPNPLGLPLPLVAGPSKWPVPSPCSLIRGRPGPGVGQAGLGPLDAPSQHGSLGRDPNRPYPLPGTTGPTLHGQFKLARTPVAAKRDNCPRPFPDRNVGRLRPGLAGRGGYDPAVTATLLAMEALPRRCWP